MGPNEKKLINRKMASIMIPSGGSAFDDSAFDGFNFPTSGDLPEIVVEVQEWVKLAIGVVKAELDNPIVTDEEIAGAILEKLGGIGGELGSTG